MTTRLSLIGYASGIGANDPGCAEGPIRLRNNSLEIQLSRQGVMSYWHAVLTPRDGSEAECLERIAALNLKLAQITFDLTQQNQHFVVLGGDHSSAIGTWSGVAAAQTKQEGTLGLIWIDAHMDSHTFETTRSGNIHGMPLAALMGYGDVSLTQILTTQAKIDPRQLSLIGIRSFEAEEAALLTHLGVRIYRMEEIRQRGLKTVFSEAIARAKKNSLGFGVSLDLDGIDPKDAPGVGVVEKNGILAKELCQALSVLRQEKQLIGVEVVEYNPYHDKDCKTERLIKDILVSIFGV
jgi:arginase